MKFILASLWIAVALAYVLPASAADQPALTVELLGLDGEVRANAEALLSIYKEQERDAVSKGRIMALHQRAGQEIARALQTYGYYRVQLESSLESVDGVWRARYVVNPGAPVRIREFDVDLQSEDEDPQFAELVARNPMASGEVLRHADWESLKADLARLAAELGYLDAHLVENTIEVHREKLVADVHLHYALGRRYHFGELQIPDTVIDKNMLRRYANIRAGEPYHAGRLIDVQQALVNTDFFSAVQVDTLAPDTVAGEVPIVVSLTPRPAQKYSVGGGFGTDTGIRARGGWERRYLFGKGHRASADLRLSTVSSSLIGRYSMPYRNPRIDRLGITVGLLNEDTDVSDSQRFNVGVSNSTVRWSWQETLSLDYQLEQFDVGESTETKNLLLPSARWTRTWADDRIYAARGLRLNLSALGAHTALLSDTSFLRLRADAKLVRRVTERGRLIARADIGAAVVSNFDDLPATQRFFAGGDNSLRGFDFRSLGPRDENGDVIGGKYLAVGSIEYEHRVKGEWRAAVFSDFGNAFDKFGDKMQYSVGAGVRWLSPVGLLRVDVAVGVSDDDLPVRLHIVVGPDF